MFTIHYPTQDSWYLLDPCGEIEENIGDNEDHDDDEDDTKMEENIIALITENWSIWNKGNFRKKESKYGTGN